MNPVFGQTRDGRVTRKGVAALLVFWLNLILLPCAMAVEAPSEGHDCCPPSIELQQTDCCEMDAAAEKRGGKFKAPDDQVFPQTTGLSAAIQARPASQKTRPPNRVVSSPPLHKLYCVYLD